MLVAGHKHAMEVCEEQLSNTEPSSPIRQSCTTEAFEWEELQRRSEPRVGHTE